MQPFVQPTNDTTIPMFDQVGGFAGVGVVEEDEFGKGRGTYIALVLDNGDLTPLGADAFAFPHVVVPQPALGFEGHGRQV